MCNMHSTAKDALAPVQPSACAAPQPSACARSGETRKACAQVWMSPTSNIKAKEPLGAKLLQLYRDAMINNYHDTTLPTVKVRCPRDGKGEHSKGKSADATSNAIRTNPAHRMRRAGSDASTGPAVKNPRLETEVETQTGGVPLYSLKKDLQYWIEQLRDNPCIVAGIRQEIDRAVRLAASSRRGVKRERAAKGEGRG